MSAYAVRNTTAVLAILLTVLAGNGWADVLVNKVGVYFDEQGINSCMDSVGTYPYYTTAHLVLQDALTQGGIGGWEARITWDSNLVVSLANIRGTHAVPVQAFPELRVGFGTPLAADSTVVLADLAVWAMGPGALYLKPAQNPMIEGAESPIFVFGDDSAKFGIMNYAYGDSGAACAVIGNLPCPLENDYNISEPDTTGNELSSELIIVARAGSMLLPDLDDRFGLSRIGFGSAGLWRLFVDQPAMRARRVFGRNAAATWSAPDGGQVERLGGCDAWVLHVGDSATRYLVAQSLARLPEILSVEPNAAVEVLAPDTDDPGYDDQWGLHGAAGMRAEQAWATTTGAAGVAICVVDRGVRNDHSEFIGKLSGDVGYYQDHGARVAGIAAAIANNGIGIAGISWGARVNSQYLGNSTSDIADAIADGIATGPDVMNHSYRLLTSNGANMYSPLVHRLFMDAYKTGIVHTVASGNYYTQGNPFIYPARNGWAWDGYAQGMIVAGGIDELGNMYDDSTSGPHVDLVAPAVDVISTTNGNALGAGDTGTSFAAPHAAGAAALLLSVEPGLDPDDIDEILKLSAFDMFGPGRDDRSGNGRLNVAAALDSLTTNDFEHVSVSTAFVVGEKIESRHGYVLEGFPGVDPVPLDFDVIRIRVNVVFPHEYVLPPHVWGIGNGSTGLPEHSWYNIPYTKVVEGSVTETGCTLETYVYEFACPWTPPPNCPPATYLPASYSSPWYQLNFAYSILGKRTSPASQVGDDQPRPAARVAVVGPNPFNAAVELRVELSDESNAELQIFDVAGRQVRTFGTSAFSGGARRVIWDGRDQHGRALPSGVYFAVFKSGSESDTEKLVMLK